MIGKVQNLGMGLAIWQKRTSEIYPLVMTNIAIENGPVEIVDFPTKNSDFP